MNFQSINSRKLKQSLSNKDITTPIDIKQPALYDKRQKKTGGMEGGGSRSDSFH